MSLKELFGDTAEPTKETKIVTLPWRGRSKHGVIIGVLKTIKLTCPQGKMTETAEYKIVKWEDGSLGGIHGNIIRKDVE